MRTRFCVPMMAFVLLLTACAGGGTGEKETVDMRQRYHDMTGCIMEAAVTCTQEVLEPESIAGVKAVLSGSDWRIEYEDACLNAGPLGSEEVSPAACLPRLMNALRDGWLLEENQEDWNETPCLRLSVDQSGLQDGKIVSTVWLRQEDGTPLRGEIAVDGEIILTADFTSFAFCDTIEHTEQNGAV